ncbi:actin-like ATPase domain-containing protein [Pluteus cervinus]|uniref:Actin-like ATPase domain-containing protein n=1 Tax=Pluteus cervinus TaxID=181527 RepID=A0ACD3A9N1_9AGAR|nr:actin-like ATPase domain-containing protein [Pluteus cervinus]
MPPKSTPKPTTNGVATPPVQNEEIKEETTSIPPVVGINFGNSYASIAVFTKEGLAECIANEDGERQIACAIAFHGEETYIGNPAKHHLVKNAKNTIIGFRNLLGKKFSEISQSEPTTSAPVIQHPDIPDEPAYKVQVLQPAPSPLPASAIPSHLATPAASHAPTPRSEPVPAERILSVSDVTTLFIKSLIQSAADFLGKKIQGTVITVPSWFSDTQRRALEKAATNAGVEVLQLLDEAGAAAGVTSASSWTNSSQADRTQLLVDVGASSVSLSLLSIREGLAYSLASSSTPGVGGDQIDDKIIKFFATEFTKKTKTPLTIPAADPQDKRADAKLRLAIEHTKRTISASPGAATCSVESLKDGIDFTGTINRMRFDLVAKPVYNAVAAAVTDLLALATVDAHHVDEVVYVGGTTCLPGLDEQILVACGFKEDVSTPFAAGTVVGGGIGDPTTILARGCAIQAALLSTLGDDNQLREAFEHGPAALNNVAATSKTIGLLFPDPTEEELGGTWLPVVLKETPVPARRTIRFDVQLKESTKKVAFEVWEATESFHLEKPPKLERTDDDDDDDEEEEEDEVKVDTVEKNTLLGVGEFVSTLGIQIKGKSKDAGKWIATVEAQVIVGVDGALVVSVKEIGDNGAGVTVKVPAAS